MRNLAVSPTPETTIRWIKDELTTALKATDAVVSRGDIRIENDRLVVPKFKAAPEDERLKAIRRELFAGVGKIQLPDLLIAMDATTHFSWALLGRTPRSEHELIILYAALIALGSDLTAADMARMTLNIEADAVGEMMRRIEANGRLPWANRLVLGTCFYGLRHRPRVAGVWRPTFWTALAALRGAMRFERECRTPFRIITSCTSPPMRTSISAPKASSPLTFRHTGIGSWAGNRRRLGSGA